MTFQTTTGTTDLGFQAQLSGQPYGASNTGTPQILQTFAVNGFSLQGAYSAMATMGAVQSFVFPVGSGAGSGTFPVGSASSPYTASAQVQAVTVTPLFTGSTFIVQGFYGAHYVTAASFSYNSCLYLNSTGFPVAFAFSQITQTNSFVLDQPAFTYKTNALTAGVPVTFNVCMYEASAAPGALSGPYSSNGLIITELVSTAASATVPLLVSPISMPVVNIATPVLAATVPVPTNSSILCSGTWFASDLTNFTGSNGGDFFFVGQRAGGVASIANSNIPSNIIGTLGVAPYIQISVASSNAAIQIYCVGALAKNYQFEIIFNTL
jgi:hypothetical protein